MTTEQAKIPSQGGLKAGDIVLVLIRRKWLILLFSTLGITASILFYFLAPAMYRSDAKLFIRYVLERKMPTGTATGPGAETQFRQPDSSGKNIIASEVEVLTSYDLAMEVAKEITPQKLLGKQKGITPTEQEAAVLIRNSIKIENPRNSDVLRISFLHTDPSIVQPVLDKLITSYQNKHENIHRNPGVKRALEEQALKLNNQLIATEEALQEIKRLNNISSLEETKKAHTEKLSRLEQEISDTQAQMAERQAALASMQKATGTPTMTNQPATNAAPAGPKVQQDYRDLLTSLESLRKKEQNYSRTFTSENVMLRGVQAEIADKEKVRLQLESQHPDLAATSVPITGSNTDPQAFDPNVEKARIDGLQAKLVQLVTLKTNLSSVISRVQQAEPELLRLQREKELQENQYRYFKSSSEQASADGTMAAADRLSNIGVAQSPSPAFRESRQMVKIIALLLISGIALGILLAIALELYFAPSIKTESELKRRIRNDVFISIPALRLNGSSQTPVKAALGDEKNPETQVVRWDPGNRLQVYYEGLRDRLMTWFEIRNLTRKPKLVAVTSCENGAGVSSIAAGLAATLSETGDGRVLLVDMNVGQGAAHSFYKGRPGCGLDEALESGTQKDAQVNDNLFVVSEGASNRDKLPSILPRRFTNLVPKLKASDFDYIIFDMPPVASITITPRLSTYMDMVLLVVEAEKTSPHVVKAATDLLEQSKASFAAVLNKVNNHNPKWLGLSN